MPLLSHPRCPFCHEGVRPGDRKTACLVCMGWHHLTCWKEHGCCASCGRRKHLGVTKSDPEEGACPGCGEHSLLEGQFERLRLAFCSTCWGTWVPHEHLGPLLLSFEDNASLQPERRPGPRSMPPRPCAVCGLVMTKWAWRELIFDGCRSHGLWLESGELLALRHLACKHPQELYDLLGDTSGLADTSDELPTV